MKLFALTSALLGLASLSLAQTTTTSTGFWSAPGAITSGTREFTLGAAGASDRRFSGSDGGASGSLGWYLNEATEVLVRQSVSFSTGNRSLVPPPAGGANTGTGTGQVPLTVQSGRRQWSAATRLAIDQNFATSGPFRPFLGANFGGTYGRSVRDTWAAGLEAGAKAYVQPRTFIVVLVEYGWFFNRAHNIDNRFRDGQFTYSAGVGFNF
jgi:hypothetical protein